MLDDFKEENEILYKYLTNIIKKKPSHAYLFNSKKNLNYENIIFSFIKTLICDKNYTNKNNCINCNICEKIDKNIFSEIKIIKPENMIIKKEQLLNLKKNFSKKSIESNKKIYIIYEAEKMNIQAANSILKFLEEPNENIIAILITENINQMLKTIVSRCQNINLYKNKSINLNETTIKKINQILINKEIEENTIKNVIDFIITLTKTKIKMINYNKKMYNDLFKTKEEQTIFFEIAILFLKDIINYNNINKIKIFTDYENEIKLINDRKIDVLKITKEFIKAKELIKNNINSNLLIDKLVINLKENK